MYEMEETDSKNGRDAMKCLVVEDDVVSNKILNSFLTRFGECTTVFDGDEAVEAYHNALRLNEPFDLICMDIMMPRLDGHKALAQIRDLEQQHSVSDENKAKVIMTTCLDEEEDIRRAFRHGCNAFMIKPIHQQSLRQEIENLGLLK